MEKEKRLAVVVIILVWAVGLACAIFYVNNKYSYKAPINHYIDALNNNDISQLTKAFHEYCALAMEEHIEKYDKEAFDEYFDIISQRFGSDHKFSYKIIDVSSVPQEYIEMYETNAKELYSDYPYLSNGGTLKFDDMYMITTEITVKGKDNEETDTSVFLVVEIDNRWYFLHNEI